MVPSKAAIRSYSEADLPKVIELYESTPNSSPCFARDDRLLRHLTRYPGVSADSVFVAAENDRIVGLAIASITTEGGLRQGSIIELRATDASCVKSLVQAASDYCAGREVDMMVVVPPVSLDTGQIFTSWLEFERTVMMCKPLCILPLLRALLDVDRIRKPYVGKEVLFAVDGETIQVRILADRVEAVQVNSAPGKRDILVTLSSKTLLAIATGVVSPYVAYLARSVRIQGARDVPMVLRLLRALRLDMPWFVALGDSL